MPFQRALTIWFTPRTELLPIDGNCGQFGNSGVTPADFLVTAGFGALGYLYIALALGGIFIAWRASASGSAHSNPQNASNLWGITLLLGISARAHGISDDGRSARTSLRHHVLSRCVGAGRAGPGAWQNTC